MRTGEEIKCNKNQKRIYKKNFSAFAEGNFDNSIVYESGNLCQGSQLQCLRLRVSLFKAF